jgi:hypothetical protein
MRVAASAVESARAPASWGAAAFASTQAAVESVLVQALWEAAESARAGPMVVVFVSAQLGLLPTKVVAAASVLPAKVR